MRKNTVFQGTGRGEQPEVAHLAALREIQELLDAYPEASVRFANTAFVREGVTGWVCAITLFLNTEAAADTIMEATEMIVTPDEDLR